MTPSLLVTGTRYEPTPEERRRVISLLTEAMPVSDEGGVLFVGDCPTGIDRIAREVVAKRCGWTLAGDPDRGFVADWKRLGKKAGPLRNADMVEAYHKAGGAWAIGLPAKWTKSNGTMGCVSLAAFAGIRTDVHPVEVNRG